MRRVGRYILGGLAVCSLRLAAATVLLWVRSHRAGESLTLYWDVRHSPGGPTPDGGGFLGGLTRYRLLLLISDRGRLELACTAGGGPPSPALTAGKVVWREHVGGSPEDEPAFEFHRAPAPPPFAGGPPTFYLRVPHAVPAAAWLVLPAWRAVRWWRRRRTRRRALGLPPGAATTCGRRPSAAPSAGGRRSRSLRPDS